MVERFEQSKLTKPKETRPKVKQAILAVLYTACASGLLYLMNDEKNNDTRTNNSPSGEGIIFSDSELSSEGKYGICFPSTTNKREIDGESLYGESFKPQELTQLVNNLPRELDPEAEKPPFLMGVLDDPNSPWPEMPQIPVDEVKALRLLEAEGLPSAVDLSSGLPPIGTQNSFDCTFWATFYNYKSFQESKERWWRNLTEPIYQFSPEYGYNQLVHGNCDQGISIMAALQILQDQGALSLTEFPDDPGSCSRQPTQAERQKAASYQNLSYASFYDSVGQANIGQLKAHLASGDIFVSALLVGEEFNDAGCNVVYRNPYLREPTGGHAMAVVGYDDTRGAFKFANSWGTNWGCNGFGWVSYSYFQQYAYRGYRMTDRVIAHPEVLVTSIRPNTYQPNWGEDLAYTVRVTSSVNTSGLILEATLTNTTFMSCTDGCSHDSGVITWSLGDLGVGSSVQRTITVSLPDQEGRKVLIVTTQTKACGQVGDNPPCGSSGSVVFLGEPERTYLPIVFK